MAGLHEIPTKPEGDRIIVVMGPTGTGKTTFINCVAKRGDNGVGHSIKSCTDEVKLIGVEHAVHGRKVVLVDTPGFDDTFKPDIDILTEIAVFLIKSYQKGLPLDTILYLHRISDRRMTGSLLKNLRMFASLCGIRSMPNVIIVTTMWGDVNREGEGEKREEELRVEMWSDMIEKGCHVRKFSGTYQSALDILDHVPKTVESPLLAWEMVERRKKLKATAAGSELSREIKSLQRQRKAKTQKLQQLSRRSTDEAEKRVLEEEIEETKQQIKKTSEEQTLLKRNIIERFFGPKPEVRLVPQVGSPQSN
ncbi:hypothetical protein FRB91_011379 [Serendipita sp. 411]|nr:hypothetical protein FRB91_011379 [Serendipita sp. 411]